jgi:polysaccharide pyruvyl transferase WcaK-like protein
VLETSSGQHITNILVYGWYHQGNLGDDLFVESFQQLFPTYHFRFVNQIAAEDLKDVDGVFIGGGSLLGENLNLKGNNTLYLLLQKKIFYIGVGAETAIHSSHCAPMSAAQLIAIRSPEHLDKVKVLNPNAIAIPDIVHSLSFATNNAPIEKSVLVVPNILVVPTWSDPHWKHASWEYFKNEFAQFLDGLVESKYQVNFLPMCVNPKLDDRSAASEIVNRMTHRHSKYLLDKPQTLSEVISIMSQYQAVITQRYHGIVLAEMAKVPCLTIYHHDKLKNSAGPSVSYYGAFKAELNIQLNNALMMKSSDILPIDRDIFRDLTRMVNDALCSR